MTTFPVVNILEGKESTQIELPADLFNKRINQDVIHQAVVMYQACLRQGTADTKERGQVSGGGKKPYRQKGTGRARVGSSRSPIWQGGGVTFGPHPRDFRYSVPRKIKKVALRESLNAKIQAKDLVCIDDVKQTLEKTKEFNKFLQGLELTGKILALFDGCDESIIKVSRNIPRLTIMRAVDVNAYDILRNRKVLLTKTAFQQLLDRIKK